MARFQQDNPRRARVSSIDVRLTIEDAVVIMRAISAQQWREPDADKREDLELLRLKVYDSLHPIQPQVIPISRCA